jgi:MATE family multidrug resistance protein
VEAIAREYFRIRIWAAPATLGLYVLNGWFLGMQNAKYPMITAIAANVLNIVLSFIFVKSFHLNAAGVALGTVIAQYLGILVGLFLFFRSYKPLVNHWNWPAVIDPKALKNFFQVNSDIFVRTFCVIFVFTFFTSKSASINDHILAVNSILIQFLLFFAFFIDGFAYAGEALSGRYKGERNRALFLKVTRLLFYWGGLLAFAFSLIYLFANELILGLLTNQTDLIATALDFRFWIVLTPIISFASFIWDGVYIGATASREMRNSMLGATLLVFLPGYFLLQPVLGNHALWRAMMLFMLSRGVFQAFLFPRVMRKNF